MNVQLGIAIVGALQAILLALIAAFQKKAAHELAKTNGTILEAVQGVIPPTNGQENQTDRQQPRDSA